MPEAARSPFGKALREYRQHRGLSQAALADLITERARDDRAFARLGVISDRTISNLEAVRSDASKFVRPRPHTVRILAEALNIEPGTEEEIAFLMAAEQTRARSAASPTIPPETVDRQTFVTDGREDHFQRLKDAWTLAQAGSPQLILLAGDAGSGKTHMVRELCSGIRERQGNVRIACGECTSGASSVSPYLPFLQAMNSLLGLVDRHQNLVQQSESIDALLTIAPTLIGTMVDEPALLTCVERLAGARPDLSTKLHRVLGVRNATDASGRLDQAVRLLAEIATSTPVVLILEDLHWAGEPTAALLLHLQRQLWQRHSLSLLIIGTYRPSDLAIDISSRHPLEPVINEIGRQIDDVVVDLGTSIGTDRGRAFINGLLQTLSIAISDEDALSEFLFSRTEGHPLFAIELVRWLQDTGGLEKDGQGRWHLSASAMERTAPAKVRSVIAERIDRLPKHLRTILEAASIHGTTVAVDFLDVRDAIPTDQLQDLLDNQLVKRYRLLRPHNSLRVGDRRLHVYRFRHALFQEYLYETLSPRERERLHGLLAENAASILEDSPHILSGEIAFHFKQAHRYRDAAVHAYAAAALALQQLDYDLASHWLQLTETYAREADDRWHVYAAQNGQVSVMRGYGELDASLQLASEVAINAHQEGYRDLEAESEDLLGQVFFDLGNLQSAVSHLEQAASLHRDLDQHAALSGTEAMLSHTYYRLGAYDDALVHAHRAHLSAQSLEDHAHAAEALLAAGNCEVDLGRYEIAITAYRRANAIYVRAGEVRGEVIVALNIGLCRIQLREWDEAVSILRDARDTTEVLRTPRLQAAACHYLSLALEGLGNFTDAKDEIHRSLALRRSFGQHGNINDNIATLLRIAMAEDDMPAVREHLQQLHAWTNACGGEGIEDPSQVFLSMAHAHTLLGNPEASRDVIAEGYELLKKRASKIEDPSARSSYLENVPANRQLIAWRERGKPSAQEEPHDNDAQ
jgi:tetratricopeptide (TPR) repeat protein/transcriptional regulator with XRE-family HTH domain